MARRGEERGGSGEERKEGEEEERKKKKRRGNSPPSCARTCVREKEREEKIDMGKERMERSEEAGEGGDSVQRAVTEDVRRDGKRETRESERELTAMIVPRGVIRINRPKLNKKHF